MINSYADLSQLSTALMCDGDEFILQISWKRREEAPARWRTAISTVNTVREEERHPEHNHEGFSLSRVYIKVICLSNSCTDHTAADVPQTHCDRYLS